LAAAVPDQAVIPVKVVTAVLLHLMVLLLRVVAAAAVLVLLQVLAVVVGAEGPMVGPAVAVREHQDKEITVAGGELIRMQTPPLAAVVRGLQRLMLLALPLLAVPGLVMV
jgi:hypothetical protein